MYCNPTFHSGRSIGSSLTDFALQVKSNKEYETQDYLVNYRAKAQGKEFVASTYYIKNKGRLIGMLCLNTVSYTHLDVYKRQHISHLSARMRFHWKCAAITLNTTVTASPKMTPHTSPRHLRPSTQATPPASAAHA